MNNIKVRLLGAPEVLYNNQPVAFPFRKVEALFYYLVVKKNASRDELVDLLWSELEENLARKNLRNAVYMLKKLFNTDVVISPQRANIILNNEISWDIDLEAFVPCNSSYCVDIYTDEFLQGFLIKDAENFQQWMFHKREQYQYMYISKLNTLLKECWNNNDMKASEKYCKKLISVDHLDEDAYRQLMRIYCKEGQYNKGIEIYNKLKSILDKELSISPDNRTIKVFEDLVKSKNSIADKLNQRELEFFYGREEELELLYSNYDSFLKNNEGKFVVVLGEVGIGKTKLIERFFKLSDLNDIELFEAHCYQAEENFPLKPWNNIFLNLSQYIKQQDIQIPDNWRRILGYLLPVFDTTFKADNEDAYDKDEILKYQLVESVVVNILRKAAQYKKILLFFEDIQWIDDMSLSLLKNVIVQDKGKSILIIATCRNTISKSVDRFITEASVKDLGIRIELTRLSREDTLELASQVLSGCKLTGEFADLIYKETEGNIFFLMEFLNSIKQNNYKIGMTSRMKDILKSRVMNISEEGKKILNMASVFFDKASFDILRELSGKDELELIDIIEELQQKALLSEIVSDRSIELEFTHQKLREYIYDQMSASRKRLLHIRIAKLLEGRLQNNADYRQLYSKIIYHYANGNDKLAQLKYSIKNLEEYLQFSNEIFPILNDIGVGQSKNLYLSYEQAQKQLTELELLVSSVGEYVQGSKEFKLLELSFQYMMGRYHIGQGSYDKGISIIDKLIQAAESMDNTEYLLKGYRQKIYYCINIRDTENMGKYIEIALQLANKTNDDMETGILLRLKGFYSILIGSFENAEALLESSISIFDTQENKSRYLLNIAGAYNYIGESKRCKKQFAEALQQYNKAIAICEDNKLIRGVAIFHTNAGQAAYDFGDYDTAKEHLARALSLYSQLDTLWRRSTANGYMCLILIKEESYKEALYHLKEAEAYGQKIKNPYEMGIVNRIKAEVYIRMYQDTKAHKVFEGYINETLEYYCDTAINMLHEFKDCYEIERVIGLTECLSLKNSTINKSTAQPYK